MTSCRPQLTTRTHQGVCRGRNAGEDRQCASVKNPTRPAEDGAAHAKTRASRNLARVCTHRRRSTTIRLLLQMQVHVPLSALQMKSICRVRVHLAGTPTSLDLAARQWLYSLGRCKYVHDIDHSAQVLAMLTNRGDELGRHSGLGGGGKRPPGVCRYHSLLRKGPMCPPPTLSLPAVSAPSNPMSARRLLCVCCAY